ncbi:37534_t:CDS:1, partial [Gigaspora margarita]
MSYNVGDAIRLSEALEYHNKHKYKKAWKYFYELATESRYVNQEAKFMIV